MDKTYITAHASIENISLIVEFVSCRARDFGLDQERIAEVMLAVEEAAANVVSYAYPEGGGEVEVSCSGLGDDFIIEIADSGIPFDLLSVPEPDTTASIEERTIGGLGVLLIRKLMDKVEHRREEGRNTLHLVARRHKAR